MRSLRIGSGAGFSGDQIEPAVELADRGALDYLVFECLAERTIALAHQSRRSDPGAGYDPLLDRRMSAVLTPCARNGVKIVSNMGAANPFAAAQRVKYLADRLGLTKLRVAAVLGDDVLDTLRLINPEIEETRERFTDLGKRIISANAYVGAEPIVDALRAGADIVITGRTADPALFLAPLMHEFKWSASDWPMLGKGVLVGHLLECAGQASGGYFADPPCKVQPDLARLGFPLAEVREDGELVLSKVEGSGGRITEATCKEQLLYEIHDPAAYIQPDVVADFSRVGIESPGPDRVRVRGATGRARPERLKVSVGYLDGWIGDGQISYAGPGAVERGRLAIDIVRERLLLTGVQTSELRCDLIGLDSMLGPRLSRNAEPYEARVRVAGHAQSAEEAARIGMEVESLYTNGPAGGGGVSKSVREVIAIGSTYMPRERIRTQFRFVEATP